METVAAVFVGGGLGAVLRHFANNAVMHAWGRDFPLGIMVINIIGSFAMGVLIGLFAHVWDAPQNMRMFLTVGILGGFTTFSSFSMNAVELFQHEQYLSGIIYVVGSVLIGALSLVLGMWLVRNLGTANV
jgi:CrcB protein